MVHGYYQERSYGTLSRIYISACIVVTRTKRTCLSYNVTMLHFTQIELFVMIISLLMSGTMSAGILFHIRSVRPINEFSLQCAVRFIGTFKMHVTNKNTGRGD